MKLTTSVANNANSILKEKLDAIRKRAKNKQQKALIKGAIGFVFVSCGRGRG